MSNGTNTPYGLSELKTTGAGIFNLISPAKIFTADDTGRNTYNKNIFRGDPIMANQVADQDGIMPKYGLDDPTAEPSKVGFLGILAGCNYFSTIGTQYSPAHRMWNASTTIQPGMQGIKALILSDPSQVYVIQVSTSTNNPEDAIFLESSVYKNANLAIKANAFIDDIYPNNPGIGNIGNGQSAYYLDNSTVGNEPNKDVKIIGISPRSYSTTSALIPGVDMPFIEVLVKFNRHFLGSTGTPGIVLP